MGVKEKTSKGQCGQGGCGMEYKLLSGPYLRGNLHLHTTESDGIRTPKDAMKLYRSLGYDFISITDHRKVTVPKAEEIPGGLIWIPGIELDYYLTGQVAHILGLGVSTEAAQRYHREDTPQKAIHDIRACGGLAVLAHPAWSLNTTEFMTSLEDLSGIEIWNSVSDIPYNARRADASALLDPVFAQGRLLPVLANDDTHFYGEELAKGWNMVRAETKDADSILKAVEKGNLYTTQGPEIHELLWDGEKLRLQTSPCELVIFYSNVPYARGRCVRMHDGTCAEWKILEHETYIRIQAVDAAGRSAWTKPYDVQSLRRMAV
mgnify:CR=1 FL=1